jgi:hypothetical protein
MSTVFLQVGQCGNQVGFQLWKFLKDEVSIRDNTVFCKHSERARCVMIDSEPKVVEKPFLKVSHPLFNILSPSLVVKSSSGRGNNWATGYADRPERDESLSVRTMELLRREVENCDYYKGCVLVHSLAGGTGSGLGSKLLELIRDEYSVCFISTVSVLPSELGDTPLQDYNSVLGLSSLQQYADAVIYFENDDLMRLVQQFNKRGSNVSTHNINELIAFSLCNLLVPARPSDIDFSGFFNDLVPCDSYKFIETKSFPFVLEKQSTLPRETGWTGLLDSAVKNYARAGEDLTHSTICAKAFLRGEDAAAELSRQIKAVYAKVSTVFKQVPWVDRDYLKISLIPARGMTSKYGIERVVTLAGNRTSVVYPVSRLLMSAKAKFQAGAYLHWYQKYSCGEEQLEAFEVVEGLVQNYQNALKINNA